MLRRRYAILAAVFLLASCNVTEADNSVTTPAAAPTPTSGPTSTAPAASPVSSPTTDDADVLAGLADLVIPLDSTEPDAPLDDLQVLQEMLGDASVVGLGESTHGTREFMTLRHRMIRLLVEDLEFRYIALEAPWSGIEVVNQYAQGEEVDTATAQDGLSYFTLKYREFWDLVEWVRDHNQTVDPTERVHFVGIDPQIQSSAGASARIILEYIAAVDPEAVETFNAYYAGLDDHSGSYPGLEDARNAYETMVAHRDEYLASSSEESYEHALHASRMIYQGRQILSRDQTEGFRLREQFMADNVHRVIEQAGAGARVIVWGHNSHVSKENPPTLGDVMSLGGLLVDRHGRDYVSIGFDFSEGSFVARDSTDLSAPPATFTIAPGPDRTYAHQFRRLEPSNFMIDLRHLDSTSPAGEWLTTPQAVRTIGCCYMSLYDPLVVVDIANAFDILVFVEHMTAPSVLDEVDS